MGPLAALLIAGGAAAQFGAVLHPYDWEIEYFFEQTWDVNFWLIAGCVLLLGAAVAMLTSSRPRLAGAFAAGAAAVMAAQWLGPILSASTGDYEIPGELWVALLGAGAAFAGGLTAVGHKTVRPAASTASAAASSQARAIPAGWYADPSGAGLRWWDGSAWTEHTKAN